jgi:hypothetical protein
MLSRGRGAKLPDIAAISREVTAKPIGRWAICKHV